MPRPPCRAMPRISQIAKRPPPSGRCFQCARRSCARPRLRRWPAAVVAAQHAEAPARRVAFELHAARSRPATAAARTSPAAGAARPAGRGRLRSPRAHGRAHHAGHDRTAREMPGQAGMIGWDRRTACGDASSMSETRAARQDYAAPAAAAVHWPCPLRAGSYRSSPRQNAGPSAAMRRSEIDRSCV